MVRRHPHVFGDASAKSASEVLKNWEQLKVEERRVKAAGSFSANGEDSAETTESRTAPLLGGIPRSLPAVLEAYQLTRRAARVGFDWPDAAGVLEKLREEA